MFDTLRRALLVLALLFAFLSVGARSANAQTFTPSQAQQMLNMRLKQAYALDGMLQQLSAMPASQVPGSSVQSAMSQYQAMLAKVQYQINQLQLLANALNQAYAVDALIQNPQYQNSLPSLQYALATIQAQISNLQATIAVP